MSSDFHSDHSQSRAKDELVEGREDLPLPRPPLDGSLNDEARFESSSTASTADGSAEVELAICWRCEKSFPGDQTACHWCAAPNRERRTVATSSVTYTGDSAGETTAHGRQMKLFVLTFGLMLITSVIHGAIMLYGGKSVGADPEAKDIYELTMMTSIEVVDTILVFFALANCGKIVGTQPARRPWIAWLLLLPALAGLISINFGYHHLVQLWVGPQEDESIISNPRLWWWVLLTFCLQPAIVEELFVRYLMLGILRQHTSTGAAIFISSLAFALLHLGMPLSVPYLFLAGMVFGYLRVASGGLLLPITAHFIHNFIVVFYLQS